MNALKKCYNLFCKAEEITVSLFILSITILVFVSAVARTIGSPLNWAQDVSLLLFAWVVFLGADIALRRADFLRVDVLIERLPIAVQRFFYYLWYLVAIGFLGMMARYGIPLAIESAKRLFQTLGISYSWATISVPIGSILMIITIIIKLITRFKEERLADKGKEEA